MIENCKRMTDFSVHSTADDKNVIATARQNRETVNTKFIKKSMAGEKYSKLLNS